MSWDDEYTCPVCKTEECVPTVGKSKVFLIGSYPGDEEIKRGIPYVGATGELLRTELAYLGLDMHACKLGNLWLHAPNDSEECLNHSVSQLLKDAKKCKAILLIGSQAVKYFTGQNVTDVCGLHVNSDMLSAPILMASIQPAQVFHKAVGEMRLALSKFVDDIHKAKLI